MEVEEDGLRIFGAEPEGFGAVREDFFGWGDVVFLCPDAVEFVGVGANGSMRVASVGVC